MLTDQINQYIQNPTWLSDQLSIVTERESLILPWLKDSKLNLRFDQNYRVSSLLKISGGILIGTYYIQAIDLGRDGSIDILVILDQKGNIIEELIFSLDQGELTGEFIISKIKNREDIVIKDLEEQLEFETGQNISLVAELLQYLQYDPFTKVLTVKELGLIKFLFDFDIKYFRTDHQIDLKKINFILQRLNNPWHETEARTILHLVNNYEFFLTVKEAEDLFSKLGGIRNISLLMHQGKYHPRMIQTARNYDLNKKEMLQTLQGVKNMVIELGI